MKQKKNPLLRLLFPPAFVNIEEIGGKMRTGVPAYSPVFVSPA